MKNIYLDGFTADERLQYKEIIYSNIVSSMKTLIEACPKYGCNIEKPAEVIINPIKLGFTESSRIKRSTLYEIIYQHDQYEILSAHISQNYLIQTDTFWVVQRFLFFDNLMWVWPR